MDELYWNNMNISKLEFTPNADASERIIYNILNEANRLEARYAKRPKYLVLGVAEQMAIRAYYMTQNRYDTGDLMSLHGMDIIPVPLESFYQLTYEDASLTRSIYFYEKNKINK